MVAATDVADLLVRKGMPFREAHGVVGGLVRTALERGKALSELDREQLAAHSELLDDEYYEVLREGAGSTRSSRPAGPSAARLAEQLERRARGARGRARRAGLTRLGADFFDRSVHDVARELIGCELLVDGVGGVIVETESYERDDPACHAYVGLTPRTATLFGPPGRAYVYLSYGIHSLLNAVCEPEGSAAAVLIRALRADPGHRRDARAARARASVRELCSGPGKLTEALGDRARASTAARSTGRRSSSAPRRRSGAGSRSRPGPRIGITKATELPWRFCAAGSRVPLAAAARPRPRAGPSQPARDAAARGRRRGGRRCRRRRRPAGAASGSASVSARARLGGLVLGAPARPRSPASTGGADRPSSRLVGPRRRLARGLDLLVGAGDCGEDQRREGAAVDRARRRTRSPSG